MRLRRNIISLAPSIVARPVSEGQEQKNNADVPKMEKEIIGTPVKDFIREHIHVVRPTISESKGFKIG